MSGMFHEQVGLGGGSDNRVKSIQTRSGHRIIFTEDESIVITDKSSNEIHLDTTGRKKIYQHAGGLLGAELKRAGYLPVGESYSIEIRFLGLFDTVISDMVIKENLGYKAGDLLGFIHPSLRLGAIMGQITMPKIKTNISGLGIKKVFHITAHNEWRKNFALTPIEEGYTFSLLGSHSDIGGGYAHLDEYTAVLDYFDVKTDDHVTLK